MEPSGALFVAIEDLTIKDSVDCLDTEENLTTPGIKEDVTRPRCDAAPSPIIRDDEEIPDRILDITPMDRVRTVGPRFGSFFAEKWVIVR